MDILERLAETRIREAMERGDLDDLPGAGRPLALEDDSAVPEALRAAYRVLKNAGYVPPEIELRKQAIGLQGLLAAAIDQEERAQISKRLNALLLRLGISREGFNRNREYFTRLGQRLDRTP